VLRGVHRAGRRNFLRIESTVLWSKEARKKERQKLNINTSRKGCVGYKKRPSVDALSLVLTSSLVVDGPHQSRDIIKISSMSKISQKSHALNVRLNDFNISVENISKEIDNHGVKRTIKHFEPTGDDIRINYCDLDGVPLIGTRPRSGGQYASNKFYENVYRTRYSTPRVRQDGSTWKYNTPKGMSSRTYLNGLFHFYGERYEAIETLYITEGEFKAFVACMNGIPAVGIPGIHMIGTAQREEYTNKTFGVNMSDDLKRTLNRLPNIRRVVLIHDGDALDGSRERRNSFYTAVRNFAYAMNGYNKTRKTPLAFEYWHGKPDVDGKGIDDILVLHGDCVKDDFINDTTQFFSKYPLFDPKKTTSKHGGLTGLMKVFKLNEEPFTTPFEGQKMTVDKYVSEVAADLVDMILHGEKPRTFLSAPTGTGKTYSIIKEIVPAIRRQKTNARCALVVPTISLAEQIGIEYDLPVIVGYTSPYDIKAASAAPLFVSTYDSASKIDDIDFVFADEWHNATRAFRQHAMRDVYDWSLRAQHTVFMSGTPVGEWKEFNTQLVDVVPKDVRPMNVQIVTLKKNQKAGKSIGFDVRASRILKEAREKTGLTIIRLNDKSQCRSVKKDAIKKGWFKENEIEVITSDSKNDSKVYDYIMTNQLVPNGVRVLFTTSLMDDGVNVYNNNIDGVHFFQDKIGGRVSSQEAIQFLHRFRKWRGEFFVYYKEDKRTELNRTNPSVLLASKIKAAKMAIDELSLFPEYSTTAGVFKYYEERDLIFWSESTQKYHTNPLAIIEQTLTHFAKITPITEFARQLNEYHGVNVSMVEDSRTEENEELKEERAIIKEQNKAVREALKDAMKKDPELVLSACYHFTQNKRIKARLTSTFGDMVKNIQGDVMNVVFDAKDVVDLDRMVSNILDLINMDGNALDASALWWKYKNKTEWKSVHTAFALWFAVNKVRNGERLTARERMLAARLESIRFVLLDMMKSGKSLHFAQIAKRVKERDVRVSYDDLMVFMSSLAHISSSRINNRNVYTVNSVYESFGDFVLNYENVLHEFGCADVRTRNWNIKERETLVRKSKTFAIPVNTGVPDNEHESYLQAKIFS
jgi:hypothetical protein